MKSITLFFIVLFIISCLPRYIESQGAPEAGAPSTVTSVDVSLTTVPVPTTSTTTIPVASTSLVSRKLSSLQSLPFNIYVLIIYLQS